MHRHRRRRPCHRARSGRCRCRTAALRRPRRGPHDARERRPSGERTGAVRVSVVIPTFERAELVARAVDSVRSQSTPVDEILVVDDGSTDGTAGRLAALYPGMRVERQAHRGVSAARNRGVELARGDWVAFLDSDDEWLPAKMERQLAALAAAPQYRWVHCHEVWVRRGRRVNPRRRHTKSGGEIFESCLPLCVVSPSAVLIERRWLVEQGGFDEALPACEDYDLWLRLAAREPILYIDEPLLVKHGGREDQLSRRIWGLDRFRIRALEKALGDPVLSAAQRAAVAAELARKAAIFGAGARKRGRTAEARDYEARGLQALDHERRSPGAGNAAHAEARAE
ncbi:MAG: glycosyltransferase [Myxococcales bacterium]|nr:glycosyltransferase [Myxococcales bacterium]